uniref:aralkylamine N-acetyltransferase n=1 Tax=Clastoptera arizonana TaxID=38151 RepID=A0A1B6EAE7_9HEMI
MEAYVDNQTMKQNYWQSRLRAATNPVRMEGELKNLEYSIVPITNRDADRVVDFLRRFFFRDEPLNVAIDLIEDANSRCVELEEYCLTSVDEGVSIMAVSETGKILGVCLNGILSREEQEAENENEVEPSVGNPKFKKILTLLYRVGRESNVFKQFSDVDKVIDIKIASVDTSCRGQGIAKALFDRTKKMAKDLDIPMVRVDCTSAYSAKAVARLGFDCVYTLSYSDHLEPSTGEPVFRPEAPHTCVKTFVHLIH